jgi:hypothetical protein
VKQLNVRVLLDPTLPAREAGRIQGATEMRERIKHEFAKYATRHPDPVVADELWGFVHFIDRMQP